MHGPVFIPGTSPAQSKLCYVLKRLKSLIFFRSLGGHHTACTYSKGLKIKEEGQFFQDPQHCATKINRMNLQESEIWVNSGGKRSQYPFDGEDAVQSRAPEAASRKRSCKNQDTALLRTDPRQRQHAQTEHLGKASCSLLLMSFLAAGLQCLSVQEGEGMMLPDVLGSLSASKQRRSEGKIQVIPISTAVSLSELRDCIPLSSLLSSLPAQKTASPGNVWKFAP